MDWQSLFSHRCKWEGLLSLNVESSSNSWFSHLCSKIKDGCFQNIENLQLSVDHTFLERTDTTWKSLKILHISSQSLNQGRILGIVDVFVSLNYLPSLKRVYLDAERIAKPSSEADGVAFKRRLSTQVSLQTF